MRRANAFSSFLKHEGDNEPINEVYLLLESVSVTQLMICLATGSVGSRGHSDCLLTDPSTEADFEQPAECTHYFRQLSLRKALKTIYINTYI